MQERLAEHLTATESERNAAPLVWFGHKGLKPRNINDQRDSWTLEADAAQGYYVCIECEESSEYAKNARFEVARILNLPADVTSEGSSIAVEYHQFDQ